MTTQDWATPSLRQMVAEEIEETYRSYGNPTSKSSSEVERHILEKAQSRDNYLQMVARLILHIKEVRGSTQNSGNVPQHQSVLGQMMSNMAAGNASSGGNVINMNLQSGQNQATNQMQPTATGDQQKQVTNMPMQQVKFSQQQVQQQQQQTINTGSVFGNVLNQGNTGGQSVQVTVKNGQIVNQRGIMQQTQQQQQQQTQQQQQATKQQVTAAQQQLQQQLQLQQLQRQQQQQQTTQQMPTFMGNNTGIVMQQQQKGLLQQQQQQLIQQRLQQQQQQQTQQQQQQNKGYNNMNMGGNVAGFNMQNPMISSQQQQTAQQMSNMVANTQQQIVQQQPQQQQQIIKNAPSPSPQQQMQSSPYNHQPVPSPANPPSIAPTPSPMNQAEEMAYLEKLKELNKYVEPLRKFMLNSSKDDDHKKQREKLNGLLDILTNSKRRVHLSVLTKCEAVLKKMLPATPNSTGSMSLRTPDPDDSIPTPSRSTTSLQPMGEVVTNIITSANLMSEARQNMLPGMYALNAPMISPPAPPVRSRARPKPYDQQKKSLLPRALQMEIINLSSERFDVSLDKSRPADKEGVTLKCKYNYDSLPGHLCTISIQVHADYPKVEPKFSLNYGNGESTQDISNLILKKLARLPHSLTFTAILMTWEQSLIEHCTT